MNHIGLEHSELWKGRVAQDELRQVQGPSGEGLAVHGVCAFLCPMGIKYIWREILRGEFEKF